MSTPTARPVALLVRWYRALWALGKTNEWDLAHPDTLRMFRARRRAARRANDELWREARRCHLEEKREGR